MMTAARSTNCSAKPYPRHPTLPLADLQLTMKPEELLKQFELAPQNSDIIIEHDRQLWQARYSQCGKLLVAAGYDGTIQRWDMTADPPRHLPALTGHQGWVQAMAFHPDQQHLLTADSWGHLACWDYREEAATQIWSQPQAHAGWIRALAVSHDGKVVATGGNGDTVKLWSTTDGKEQHALAHPHRVYSLCFHSDGKSLVSGDLEGTLRHWDLATATVTRELQATSLYADEAVTKGRIQQCGGARHLQFDAAGTRLACAGQKEPGGGFANGTPCVLVFDWESGKPIREMPIGGNQDGFAYDAQFHPAGFVMATSSAFPGKGHVWFWRPEDEAAFFTSKTLPNGRSLSLHPEGHHVAHLTSQSPNGNGRALKDGKYPGGTAKIRLLPFPQPEVETPPAE